MIKRITNLLALCLVLASFTVHASEGAHHAAPGPDGMFVFPVLNFFILMLLLIWGLRQPFREYFRGRAALISRQIEMALRQSKQIHAMHEQVSAKFASMNRDAETLQRTIVEQARSEQSSIIEGARQFAKEIRLDVARRAETELTRAKQDIKDRVVGLALKRAHQKITALMTPAKHNELVGAFVNQLEGRS